MNTDQRQGSVQCIQTHAADYIYDNKTDTEPCFLNVMLLDIS